MAGEELNTSNPLYNRGLPRGPALPRTPVLPQSQLIQTLVIIALSMAIFNMVAVSIALALIFF